MRIKAHEAFKSVEEAITRNADIQSETTSFEPHEQRIMVSDTDTGDVIRGQISDLRQLLDAYRSGLVAEHRAE